MDNNTHTKKKRFSVYNVNFSTKLYTLMFILIANSVIITMVVSMKHFKNFTLKANFDRLVEVADVKKKVVEQGYAQFNKDFAVSAGSDFKYAAEELLKSYNNFNTYEYSDSLSFIKTNLSEYYKDVVIPGIKWQTPDFRQIFPKEDKTIILQNLYIAQNPHQEQKEKLLSVKINSDYNNNHVGIQKTAKAFCRKYHLSNLYIIDVDKGNVIYDMDKSIAFATNLFNGPYKDSKLSTVVHRALANFDTKAVFTDFDYFMPQNNKPVAFAAISMSDINSSTPIVLVAEMGADFFQSMLIDNWMLNQHESISLNLVGKDNRLRTNDCRFISEPSSFLKKLDSQSRFSNDYGKAFDVKSCILSLKYPESVDVENNDKSIKDNYLKEKSFIYAQPINLKGFNWYLVAQENVKKSKHSIRKTYLYILIVGIAILLFSYFMLKITTNSIYTRLQVLKKGIQKSVIGEDIEPIKTKWNDEIGSTIEQFNMLSKKIQNGSKIAIELSKGKFDNYIEVFSEHDNFANALNQLKETLKESEEAAEKRLQEDKITNWVNDGIAKFNDLLRQSNDNINELSYLIIEHLIEYLEINQGGVFLVEGDKEDKKTIHLIASYAYNRRKVLNKTIEIGEGLIGNCYLEKKPIHLKKLPQDYIEITSGLGQASPTSLYIAPLMMDNEILGFIELASLEDFTQYKIGFINKLAENIAATFASVKLNTRTAELLEESKRRANEISQQEEEMRQNMEEMLATQEELARVREEDEARRKDLQDEVESANSMVQQLLNSMNGEVLLMDRDGVILLVNEEAAKRFGSTPEKMKSMTYEQLFTPEKAQKERQVDSQVLVDGFFSEESFELVGKEDVKYFIVKKQFFIPSRKEAGILTIRSKRS